MCAVIWPRLSYSLEFAAFSAPRPALRGRRASAPSVPAPRRNEIVIASVERVRHIQDNYAEGRAVRSPFTLLRGAPRSKGGFIHRCPSYMAHVRHSRPDSGLLSKAKVPKTYFISSCSGTQRNCYSGLSIVYTCACKTVKARFHAHARQSRPDFGVSF